MANSEHTTWGTKFEIAVMERFEKKYKKKFSREKHISTFQIGDPSKAHRFDVVSEDRTVVIECKCITWTESGKIPSGKIKSVNEAVFYLSFITDDTVVDKFVVIKKSEHDMRGETLAEYYHRINRHLLGSTRVLEYNDVLDVMREIDGGEW
jgi:hypothetical protein